MQDTANEVIRGNVVSGSVYIEKTTEISNKCPNDSHKVLRETRS
jgi:hypothetical protein